MDSLCCTIIQLDQCLEKSSEDSNLCNGNSQALWRSDVRWSFSRLHLSNPYSDLSSMFNTQLDAIYCSVAVSGTCWREHPLNSVLSACPLIFFFLSSFPPLCINYAPSSRTHRFQVTDTQLSLYHYDVLTRLSFQPHPPFPRPLFHFCSRRA